MISVRVARRTPRSRPPRGLRYSIYALVPTVAAGVVAYYYLNPPGLQVPILLSLLVALGFFFGALVAGSLEISARPGLWRQFRLVGGLSLVCGAIGPALHFLPGATTRLSLVPLHLPPFTIMMLAMGAALLVGSFLWRAVRWS